MFANPAAFTSTNQTTDVHFGTGFGKRKIGGTKSHLYIFAKHFLHKKVQCLFKVGKAYRFINIQAFYLVKKTMRTGADGFVAVHSTGTDDSDRELSLLHFSDLHIAGMGTQQPVGAAFALCTVYIKSILHVTCGVIFRQIQGGKIVKVIFYFGSFSNGKTQALKNGNNSIAHQADRVA